MCGILFSLKRVSSDIIETTDEFLVHQVSCRGPDSLRTIRAHAHGQHLSFTASVLHLRGTQVTLQPIKSDTGDTLCWNGEAWEGLDIGIEENDTQALFKALTRQSGGTTAVLQNVKGPYAFVYHEIAAGKLWYGRDILGRRSLLHRDEEDGFVLCSIGRRDQDGWSEVDTTGIHCYDLVTRKHSVFPWQSTQDRSANEAQSFSVVSKELPDPSFDIIDRSQPFYTKAVDDFEQILTEALRIRTSTIPSNHANSPTSRVAVMYSGGIDCAVVARLLNKVLPEGEPVDLLNVSFENPRSLSTARIANPDFVDSDIYRTPDRLTGLQGHAELCALCPSRSWRFVEINVPYAKAQAAKSTVMDLMYPNHSVMDYSIALAFYFCALGPEGGETARVYFSGLGADEQLGGYSRHAAAFKRSAWSGLIEELQCDLDRIPTRNCGRDDRIVSSCGREVRWPFLDERVIDFCSRLRVDQKCHFAAPGGDKILVRELGRRLGIVKAAAEKKRAVQFGSRSARMEIEPKGQKVQGHTVQS